MSDKDEPDPNVFTPAIAKFTPRDKDEPVIGWVTVTAEVSRDYAEQVERAVVISDRDRETLCWILHIAESWRGTEAPRAAELLKRLIGRR